MVQVSEKILMIPSPSPTGIESNFPSDRGQISYQSLKIRCAHRINALRMISRSTDTRTRRQNLSKEITNHKYLHIISHPPSAQGEGRSGITIRRIPRADNEDLMTRK